MDSEDNNPAVIVTKDRGSGFDSSKSLQFVIQKSQQKSEKEFLPINALEDKKGFLKVSLVLSQ
jgi:hypothetical protein